MRKKLIEVALPLDAINKASVDDKGNPFIKGHPRNIHQWWARRPLPACRALVFATLVDDPGNDLPPDEAKSERERLFNIIEQLVDYDTSKAAEVRAVAMPEVLRSTQGNPPVILDPFCGGGSIPVEAQRLGLEAHASDLNPIAVLITKALIELPARFHDHSAVNPDASKGLRAEAAPKSGLCDDVRWYGRWMRDEARKRIGHLFPKGPNGEIVTAWLWTRTVTCSNPACSSKLPLVRSFLLSGRKGSETYAEPVVDRTAKKVRFEVRRGRNVPEGTRQRNASRCLYCGNVMSDDDLRRQAIEHGMGMMPFVLVCEGQNGRTYMPFTVDTVPDSVLPQGTLLNAEMSKNPRWFSPPLYGMSRYADIFTPRQLRTLISLSDLVADVRERIRHDALAAGFTDDGKLIDDGGIGITAYADAVATYLALAIDKVSDYGNTICTWNPSNLNVSHLFTKQAIPMSWDFAEVNPFAGGLEFTRIVDGIVAAVENCPTAPEARVAQRDAMTLTSFGGTTHPVIVTDPPYYSNIGYAEVSDFFYIWLRRSLVKAYPNLFSTLQTPKAQELVVTGLRFKKDKEAATRFFEEGLGKAFTRMRAVQNPDFPIAMYYAFKQAEADDDAARIGTSAHGIASTGWETMLGGLLRSGFSITGTWPIRSERAARSVGIGTNALASSVVLVCRPRAESAPMTTRKEFVRALQNELPKALDTMIKGTVGVSAIAPVDLAQAAIGPGMAVFSRYSQVLEASGEPMRVRTALELINQEIERYFSAQEGEQDGPTRFCLAWYKTYGTSEGQYGSAETLSRAYNVDVARLARQGLLDSGGGKVRVLPASAYPEGAWDPTTAHPLITWEVTHRLVRVLTRGGGAKACAPIVRRLGGKLDEARALAYLLYTEADRRGWLAEAQGYNSLVVEWAAIKTAAAEGGGHEQGQFDM